MNRADILHATIQSMALHPDACGPAERRIREVTASWNKYLNSRRSKFAPLTPGDVVLMLDKVDPVRLPQLRQAQGDIYQGVADAIQKQTEAKASAPIDSSAWTGAQPAPTTSQGGSVAGAPASAPRPYPWEVKEFAVNVELPPFHVQCAYGFVTTEVVNLKQCRVGDKPGYVTGFDGAMVKVRWPSGQDSRYYPDMLRHGP